MSHTTKLSSVPIKDIAALRAQVAEMKANGANIDLVENASPRMYYSNQHGKCHYVIKLHDKRYDVGVTERKDGNGYELVYDAWDGQVASVCGDNRCKGNAKTVSKILQGYAKHAAINAAVNQGYNVEGCDVDADGNVNITLGGM